MLPTIATATAIGMMSLRMRSPISSYKKAVGSRPHN
jgi:hypothetical protein